MIERTEAVSAEHFRTVFGSFATGVAVVTGIDGQGPVGMTVSSLCSLSLEPLLLLVCFDNEARTLPVIEQSEQFCVNVLRAGQEEVSAAFASSTDHHEKFEAIAHELVEGLPVLSEALAYAVCDLERLIGAGDHQIGIGAVRALGHDPDGEPLLWYRGEYRILNSS